MLNQPYFVVDQMAGGYHRILVEEQDDSLVFYRESYKLDATDPEYFGPFADIKDAIYDITTL